MSELTLNQLLRCAHVKRWHIMRVAREQNVAEHQWCVTTIAVALLDAIGDGKVPYKPTAEQMLWTIGWAMIHDTPEVVTGDIPAPMSQRLGDSLTDVEHETSSTWSSYRDWAKLHHDGVPYTVVKLADIIADVLFLSTEAVGAFSRAALGTLRVRLVEKVSEAKENHPNYDWAGAVDTVMQNATVVTPEEWMK